MDNSLKDHVFKVEMSCEGCAQTIARVLSKYKDQGIPKFETNLNDKTVTVTTSLPVAAVIEILRKTGKEVSYIGLKS